MSIQPVAPLTLEFHPVTPDRWCDLEKLFGKNGAYGGCWCMYWRLKRVDFDDQHGEGTRRALKKIVTAGRVPGLLAYAAGEPVGWCSIAPRDEFPTLDRSRLFKRVDDQPVWSVVCFFVARHYRRQGVTVALLRAAVEYARQHGAKIVEGYPVDPAQDKIAATSGYMGLAAAFRQVGFVEVLRRSATRPILRLNVDEYGHG